MAGSQASALAIAVSNAGGPGSLPCPMPDARVLRQELETIRAQTATPYDVNAFSHAQPARELAGVR
jgi:nitronate monooxygenase